MSDGRFWYLMADLHQKLEVKKNLVDYPRIGKFCVNSTIVLPILNQLGLFVKPQSTVNSFYSIVKLQFLRESVLTFLSERNKMTPLATVLFQRVFFLYYFLTKILSSELSLKKTFIRVPVCTLYVISETVQLKNQCTTIQYIPVPAAAVGITEPRQIFFARYLIH